VAPDLTHLAQRTTLGAGVLANTRRASRDGCGSRRSSSPAATCPSLKLTDDEVADLVAYFETLR
jgi:cytochrome c oxidase subunit 2